MEMQDFTLGMMIAVFEEMFGQTLFWGMVGAAAIITLGWALILIRDRRVSWRKFLLAQMSMPVGAVAAVWFVLQQTGSQLRHMGGPIDWIVLLAVAAAGAVGLAVLVYVLQSLIWRPTRDRHAEHAAGNAGSARVTDDVKSSRMVQRSVRSV